MVKTDIEKQASKYGIAIHEMYDRKDARKRYYKIGYPTFENKQQPGEIPLGFEEILEPTIKSARKFLTKLLSDKTYVYMCDCWIANH